MKSKFKKRIIAGMLCMVMVLSGSMSALAEDENAESAKNTNKIEGVQDVQDTSKTEEPTETTPETTTPPTTGTSGVQDSSSVEGNDVAAPNNSGEVINKNMARVYNDIYNFNNKVITSQYNSMKTALESTQFTVNNWTRSSNHVTVEKMHDAKEWEKWEWSDVSLLDQEITEPDQVWDGSRSLTHKFTDYLPDNTVTADDEKLYDSATWKRQGRDGATMYRFRGEFSLGKNEDPNDYAYTLAQVVGDKNKIYINDNIYVFVYPKDVTLTDNNFGNYLAFWTGTSSNHNPNVTFQGIKATTAKKETATGYRKLTDGWNIDAVEDNVANAIINGYKEGKKEYYVDVFVDDYASGGGMYRLDLQKKEIRKTKIEFLKVDSANISKGIPGAEFELVDKSGNGRRYTVKSDENGLCSVAVVNGTYTMREINAPTGYDAVNTTWIVTVKDGVATIKVNGEDISKNNEGKYYIKNTKTQGSVETHKNLTHEKYIKKNEDGSYDLTLNVSGATGTETNKAKVDVLFVMDTSNSMKWKMEYAGNNQDNFLGNYTTNPESRFYQQKDAVKGAVNAIAAKNTVDARYSVIQFDTTASVLNEWTSSNELGYPTKVAYGSGGTNYQAALQEAKTQLDKARADATKVVVFLSDGDVTQYVDDEGEVHGSNQYSATGMEKAQDVLKTLTMNHFYTVGVGPSTSYTHLSDLLNVVPNGVIKDSFNGTNAGNLKDAFDKIVGSITSLLCTNVTVTDTLSEYVELADVDNPEFKITVKDAEGKIIGTGTDTLTVDNTTITASYDKDTKKITLDFEDGYQLHEGYTYYVTAKIKPTDKANYKYIKDGYPDKGDENTDENPTDPKPGNDTVNDGTSSNKEGFHSNAKATVTYTYNEENKSEDYLHPVVQVDPERVTHSVEKHWDPIITDSEKEAIQVTLKASVTEGIANATADNPVEITSTDYSYLPENMTLTLKGDNGWKGAWNKLPKYYYYEESGIVKKTEIIYSVEEVQNDKYLPTYDVIKDNGIITGTKITNSLATAALDIKKTTEAGLEIDGAQFKLYKFVEASNQWEQIGNAITADNIYAEEALSKLKEGRYKLVESMAPSGCMLLGESIFFKQKKGVITLTKEDGSAIPSGEEPEMWSLDTSSNTITLTIRNKVLYDLPSAGGSGIYWYMIGGILLMLAAALISYKNKYKEVLKS